ncbi:MAG: hypothetical protein ABH885_00145 [Candidatus Omnitrophota bacterium]
MRYLVIAALLAMFAANACAAPVQQKNVTPKKIEVDTNYDGKVDRTEYYSDVGMIERVETDINGDGRPNEWLYYEEGKVVRQEQDTNDDGEPDVWVQY